MGADRDAAAGKELGDGPRASGMYQWLRRAVQSVMGDV